MPETMNHATWTLGRTNMDGSSVLGLGFQVLAPLLITPWEKKDPVVSYLISLTSTWWHYLIWIMITSSGTFVRTDFTDNLRNARLFDPKALLNSSLDYCLSFWYHMHGNDPGKLEVRTDKSSNVLWFREGDFSNRWLHGEVFLEADSSNNAYYVSDIFFLLFFTFISTAFFPLIRIC